MTPDDFDPETDVELSPMDLASAGQNEMFEAWKRSGFTEEQAFAFACIQVAAMFGGIFKL